MTTETGTFDAWLQTARIAHRSLTPISTGPNHLTRRPSLEPRFLLRYGVRCEAFWRCLPLCPAPSHVEAFPRRGGGEFWRS